MRAATRPWLTAAQPVHVILASVVLALLAVEGALRVTGWCEGYLTDPLYRRSAAPGISYELRPHAVGMAWGRTPVQTDAFGLRGPEITAAKSPGTIRIGIFGDSVTFALHLSYVIRDVALAWRSTNQGEAGEDYPPAVWERAAGELRRFAAVARARDTRALYAHLGWADVPELGGVLAELRIPMIRMRPVFERYETRVLVVSRWDPHPSAFQHQLISDALRPAVEALLAGEGHDVTQPGG
jgi:hypothetical protein